MKTYQGHTPVPEHSSFLRSYRISPDDWYYGFYSVEYRSFWNPFWRRYTPETFGSVKDALNHLDEELSNLPENSKESSILFNALIITVAIILVPLVAAIILFLTLQK